MFAALINFKSTLQMNKLLSRITTAGLIVGTLDILSAFIYYYIKTGKNPLLILQYIASGIYGKEAFSGGSTMMLTGLVLHYVIAMAFTIFFFWIFPKIKDLSKNKIMTGIFYGIFIWVVMNRAIVPLSKIPNAPFNIVNALINAAILIICIGIPLSFMANAFYKTGK